MARRKKTPDATVIDYPELRAQCARLDMSYEKIIRLSRERFGEAPCPGTIAAFFSGKEGQTVRTIKRLASLLDLRPKVVFERIEESNENGEESAKKGSAK